MIYTVTFNPAIDYIVHTDSFIPGATNRSSSESFLIGGKGINVSIILKELGIPSVALGFLAGFTGDAIERGLADRGIDRDFIRLPAGNSRINVKIKGDRESEINGRGPDIPATSLEALMDKLKKIAPGDTLILAGSVPSTLPADIYLTILRMLSDRDIRVVVDASGELLTAVLPYHPFLIKPNREELGDIFGKRDLTPEDCILYAGKLRSMGARNVLISLAGDGAILIDENDKVYRCGVCRGQVVNSVGAGDSMVAGFLAGLDQSCEYALKLGSAAGGATAFSEDLADKKKIMECLASLV